MFILHSLPCISGWNLIQHEMALSLIRKPGHILCLPAPSSVCLALWKCYGASTMAQQVKNPPAMQEMQVQSLNQEDLLEEGMATHSSILAWRIPWTEEPGGLWSLKAQRVGHNWSDWAHGKCFIYTFDKGISYHCPTEMGIPPERLAYPISKHNVALESARFLQLNIFLPYNLLRSPPLSAGPSSSLQNCCLPHFAFLLMNN